MLNLVVEFFGHVEYVSCISKLYIKTGIDCRVTKNVNKNAFH